jgi:hypothetical protein
MECLMFTLMAVLEIIAIVDVLRAAMPGGKKILWIALIVFVPMLGILFYFLLGRPDAPLQKPSAPANS